MRHKLPILILLFSSSYLFGQNPNAKGIVKDDNRIQEHFLQELSYYSCK